MHELWRSVEMRVVKDDRVYVETHLFSGWGTVTGYVRDPFFPIEITLDEGDIHGHKYKRVSNEDIKT